MSVKLFTRNYAYDFDVTIHNHNSNAPGSHLPYHDPQDAIDDYDFTAFKTNDTTPQLDIDLLSTREIDAIFLISDLKEFKVLASDNGFTWGVPILHATDNTKTHFFAHFSTSHSFRHWRIECNEKMEGDISFDIFELFLVKSIAEIKNPAQIDDTSEDPTASRYRLANGHLTSYYKRDRWSAKLRFTRLPKTDRDILESLFRSGEEFCIYPDKERFPENFFQVAFLEPIDLSYQHNKKEAGFAGSISLGQS